MRLRLPMSAVIVLSMLLVACANNAGGSSPSLEPTSTPTLTSTPAPTPTPIAADIASPEDAAALVIATDPRFEGAIQLSPDVIGASKWWEATALDDGAYRISLTIGWGDCPSGCISHHTWVFKVTADGAVTLLEESGDPLGDGSIPAG